MSVRFDSAAPGEGIEVKCSLENGKALLEWHFHYEKDDPGQGFFVKLQMLNREGRPVLECFQQTQEEEPLQSVLLHPCLWQGTESPYLYRLEAQIYSREGKQVDKCVRLLSLYVLEKISGKGLKLNGEDFCPRTVLYELPEGIDTAEGQQRLIQDMQLIRELGANGVYLEEGKDGQEISRTFFQVCKRFGLLVWSGVNSMQEECGKSLLCEGKTGCLLWPGRNTESLPRFREEIRGQKTENRETEGKEIGERKQEILMREDGTFTSQYYKYRAKWSKTPFVYIVPESISQQEKGSFSVSVYSSCKKVALYSNGVLHEFQSGSEEFVFRGIIVKGPCLILTAEAEESAQSLSIHKTFTKSSLFHDI